MIPKILHVLVLFCLSSLVVSEKDVKGVICSTKNGDLLGTSEISRGGRKFQAFRGIRYGEKPERFTDAKPVGKWNDVQNATSFGASCPQFFGSPYPSGQEDCLFLNAYTPSMKPATKHPVMIWIHGGGFQFGTSSDFDPSYFMDHDVILVSINYRLGVLGFLSSGDDQVLGNWGLKDQRLAFKWVAENIHSFGGDKDRVTIFGESAGGASVNFHVISQASKGLFKNAIAISGSVLSDWATQKNPKKIFDQLPTKTDCPATPPSALVDCLKELDLEKLLKVQNSFMEWFVFPLNSFAPVVEAPSTKQLRMITECPKKSMEAGNVNKVSFMTGMAKHEGIFFTAPLLFTPTFKKHLNSDFHNVGPLSLRYSHLVEEERNAFTKKLLQSYMGTENPEFNLDTWSGLEAMFGDIWINDGVIQASSLLSSHLPVFSYIFSYVGESSSLKPYWGVEDVYGATHSDILQYLFKGWVGLPVLPVGEKPSEIISTRLIECFVHFAQTGKPRGWGEQKEWPRIQKGGKGKWYVIDQETGVQEMDEDISRMKIWDGIQILGNNGQQKTEL